MLRLTIVDCRGDDWNDCEIVIDAPVTDLFVSDALVTYTDEHGQKQTLSDSADEIENYAITLSKILFGY